MKAPQEEPRGGNGGMPGGDGEHTQPNPSAPSWDVSALGLEGSPSSPEAAAAQSSQAQGTAPSPARDGSQPSRPSSATPAPSTGDIDPERLREAIVDVLRTVYDPEIPVNIYEIGLVYELDVSPRGEVKVQMTLTSPMCPVAESLPPEVEAKIASVQGVTDVKLDLVWDPPWNPSMMSEEARLLLNIG